MANGSNACLITALYAYIGGTSGARTGVYLTLGSASTSTFTVPEQGAASGVGYYATNAWLVEGGTARFTVHNAPSGPLYFGRSASGTIYGPGASWTGTLGGAYSYVQAPAAPAAPSTTSTSSGSLSVSWSAPGDNGGSTVTGYRVQYSTSPVFAGASTTDRVGTAATITGLTPGATYYVRVAAKNAVSDAASTVGPYSSSVTQLVLAGMKVGVDGVWTDFSVYAGVNGVWVPCEVKAGRSGAWVGMS